MEPKKRIKSLFSYLSGKWVGGRNISLPSSIGNLLVSPSKYFEEWCSAEIDPFEVNQITQFETATIFQRLQNDQITQTLKTTIDEIITNEKKSWKFNLNSNFNSHIYIDCSKASFGFFDPGKKVPERPSHFSEIDLSPKTGLKKIFIKGALIDIARITSPAKYTFENCCIKEFYLSHANKEIDLKFKNCWIKKIWLAPKSVNDFIFESGGIYSVICPPPDGENPFTGTITLSDVYFPTSRKKTSLFPGPQQYRNLRSHLEKLNNGNASSLMRAKELASNREEEKGISLWFSRLYWWVSNYGLSPGRPLIAIVIFYFMTVVGIYGLDGGAITKNPYKLKGWETSLKEKGIRSVILPVQSMLNPVGAFRQNQILIPNTAWGKIVLVAYGFISDGLLLFFILSLRKHFKIT